MLERLAAVDRRGIHEQQRASGGDKRLLPLRAALLQPFDLQLLDALHAEHAPIGFSLHVPWIRDEQAIDLCNPAPALLGRNKTRHHAIAIAIDSLQPSADLGRDVRAAFGCAQRCGCVLRHGYGCAS
jgi:hypothetical protein